MPSTKQKKIDNRAAKNSPNVPTSLGSFARIVLGLLLVMIAFANIWLAPREIATTGWFGSVRQPHFDQLGLCIVDACLALISLVWIVKNKRLGLAFILAIVLLVLAVYSWYRSIAA